MSAPLKVSDLIGAGEPRGAFLVVDPGKTTGLCVCAPPGGYGAYKVSLDGLPDELTAVVDGCKFVVCENFVLRGGAGNNDVSMPASQGIGMCRMACYAAGVPLYLAPPICKRAGRAALDEQGRAARAACRSEHERDVVDIAGYVLREMRRPR